VLSSLHTKTKLVLFLVPALAAVSFLLWWFQPERVITRRLDALLGIIDVSLLRTDTNARLENSLQSLLAAEVEFAAPDPVPGGTRTPGEVARSVQRLHQSVASCKIQRTEPSFHFPTSREARLETTLQADITGGGGSKTTRRFRAEFLYIKGPDGWKIHRIALTNL